MAAQKIACLLGKDFEDTEFRTPYEALLEAGFEVDIIGIEVGQKLEGYHRKQVATCDVGIDGAEADAYAGLLIPGGMSPEHLRGDARFVQFVRDFDKTKRPIAAICHGPQLLITAGLVRGRTLTAWTTVQEDMRQIGAHVRDSAVVVDDNWITSRKPADIPQFVDTFIDRLQHDAGVERIENRPIGQPLHP
ncbi:MAG TPA: type 1 glutamine amidotransferase domain-containing protein [Myxococcota bacterium]|nr:type 1 glutamine amidotransferase domain-containing protein [Myxococcota bacterium]